MVRIEVNKEWRVVNGPSYMASWWFGFFTNSINLMNRHTVNDWTIWVAHLLWAHQTWTAVKTAYVARPATTPPSRRPADQHPQRGEAASPEDEATYQLIRRYVHEVAGNGPAKLRV